MPHPAPPALQLLALRSFEKKGAPPLPAPAECVKSLTATLIALMADQSETPPTSAPHAPSRGGGRGSPRPEPPGASGGGSEAPTSAVAYLAITVRGEETFELFCAHARASGLTIEDLTSQRRAVRFLHAPEEGSRRRVVLTRITQERPPEAGAGPQA